MTNYQDQYGRSTDQYGYWYDGFGNKYDQSGGRYNALTGVSNDFVMFPQKSTSIFDSPSPTPPQRSQRQSSPSHNTYSPPSTSTYNPPSYKVPSSPAYINSSSYVGRRSLKPLPRISLWTRVGRLFKIAACWAIFLGGASFAYQHLNPSAGMDKGVPALSFRPACGSPPNSGSIWYGVVGTSQALDVVKSKYCGDAYVRSDKKLQVASFTSRSEADKFANNLSHETGYKFWVPN